MALEETSDFILLVFVAVSIPFYILFLLGILLNRRKEPFNSSFFTLCTSLGVADIATLVHSYLFVKAPGWSWGHAFWVKYGFRGSFLAFYANAMLWGLTLSQHIGVMLIGINRFTAVAFTFQQEKIWSKRTMTLLIALQWIVPILFVVPMTTTVFQYDYWRGPTGWQYSNNVNLDFGDAVYEEAYYISAIFLHLIVNVTTCGMYVTVLITAIRVSKKLKATKVGPWGAVGDATETNNSSNSNIDEDEAKFYPKRSLGSRNAAIHKSIPVERPYVGSDDAENRTHQGVEMRRKALRNANKQKKQITASRKMAYDRELRLAVCGFLMFLCMLIYFIFLLGVVVSRDIGFQFSFLWNISSDIVSCISPYTLIIMSKQTRVAIKRLVKCKRI